MNKVGVNLFGTAKWLGGDFGEKLDKLKDIGVTSVEPTIIFSSALPMMDEERRKGTKEKLGFRSNSVWFECEAGDRVNLIREHGLDIISVHIMEGIAPAELLTALIPAFREFGEKYDVKYFVISCSQSSIEEMDKVIPALNQIAEALKSDGRCLVYHNHHQECVTVNGKTVLDHVMEQCPDVMLELDVGWAQYAGASAVEFMRKYRGRLVLLHLKDYLAGATPETIDQSFTAIGEGCIPLKEILREAKACDLEENAVIIDQDDSMGDIFADFAVGVKNIAAILES